jgi:hypothetical protein
LRSWSPVAGIGTGVLGGRIDGWTRALRAVVVVVVVGVGLGKGRLLVRGGGSSLDARCGSAAAAGVLLGTGEM